MQVAQNGGADLLYWTGADADRAAAVTRMREVAGGVAGVLSTHLPPTCGSGPRPETWSPTAGRAGGSATRRSWSNPIPGNHGHPATEPIPFFLAGGSRRVAFGEVRTDVAHTLDVAPTVGQLFGLPAPSGGYDGTSRL